ncbi:hypothetical protein GYMLUDRAFT_42511 [Collybiopsis luxurians FD-317 M1]|uniref:Uncharacterized protein n=1 Tax=Collybiopsis luxurians FD-317 M1 TaxID=944289 RepID=A0A0D0CHF1_9AGAR|nr:hypothetical protein GYMLUDRAFT_42511 [Collybiopsis luxurians FD-317 M1]
MVVSGADAGLLPPGVSALQKFSLKMGGKSEEVFDHICTSLTHLMVPGLQVELDQRIFTYSHF